MAHSVKPDCFYDLIEEQSPGPYLELFARRPRAAWDQWGNQINSTVTFEGDRCGYIDHYEIEFRSPETKWEHAGNVYPHYEWMIERPWWLWASSAGRG